MNFRNFVVSVFAVLAMASCSKGGEGEGVIVRLQNDIVVLNEGQFGKTNGSLSYLVDQSMLSFDGNYIDDAQPGFGQTSCYMKFFYNDLLFVVSKEKPFLSLYRRSSDKTAVDFLSVILDQLTEEGEQAHAVELIGYPYVLLTTSKNIYIVDISKKIIKDQFLKEESEKMAFYDIISVNAKIFVICDEGLVECTMDKKMKNLGKATGGFTQSKDGSLWAVNYDKALDKTELLKIDVAKSTVTSIPIAVNLKPTAWLDSWPEFWSAGWRTTPMISSTTENTLFFLEYPDGDNAKLYQYDIKKNEVSVLTELDAATQSFASSALVYSPFRNEIVAAVKVPGWNDLDKNSMIRIDAKTGVVKNKVDYVGMYFPTMLVLREDKFEYVKNE